MQQTGGLDDSGPANLNQNSISPTALSPKDGVRLSNDLSSELISPIQREATQILAAKKKLNDDEKQL